MVDLQDNENRPHDPVWQELIWSILIKSVVVKETWCINKHGAKFLKQRQQSDQVFIVCFRASRHISPHLRTQNVLVNVFSLALPNAL